MKYSDVIDELNSLGFDLSLGDDFGYKEEKALTQDLKSHFILLIFRERKASIIDPIQTIRNL